MSGVWRSWACTDCGTVRTSNEDNFVARPEVGVWMVADGAGGHEHGEVASAMLAEAIGATPARAGSDLIAEVRAIVSRTHDELRRRAEEESSQTGTHVMIASTIVVMLAQQAHFACLWAGDSRIYRWRAGAAQQVTRDHSLVQELVDQGVISPAEAERHPHANVVTRAIGAEGADPTLDKVTDRAEPGDRFLLCSDGLNKALDDGAIARLIGARDPAQRLIEAALAIGARDNVTAIVVEYARPDADEAEDEDEDATLLRR